MAKLYFKYGAMGSSKSAQALITQFNYEELGMSVWLIKPSIDTRDGADIVQSRIGLKRSAEVITPEQNIIEAYAKAGQHDVIIADEAQFFTPEQIDQRGSSLTTRICRFCASVCARIFLRTSSPAHAGSWSLPTPSPRSNRLRRGRKATVNARIDATGHIITHGDQVFLGGNDSYVAMCHKCWKSKIKAQESRSAAKEN